MNISDIEEKLAAANLRLSNAIDAMKPVHKGGEVEEFQAARDEVHSLERQLAAAKGEEYAILIDFPVEWDTGAPLPFLFCNDYLCFLTFYVHEIDPNWDGTYMTLRDPSSGRYQTLALVEFKNYVSAKQGAPNNEVWTGHPLSDRGMEGYSAQQVINSRWLAELEAINSVHDGYNPERWKKLKHYIFWFHDTTFECVAESFEVEVYQASMAEMCVGACERLLTSPAD